MSTPEAPTFGPCTPWISSEDVAAVCTVLDSSGDPSVYDQYAQEASEILWAASGRQYAGSCGPTTVRPCVKDCGCWGMDASPWYWSGWPGVWIDGGGNGVSAVQNCGGGCCGYLSRVKLYGYPVTAIDEVKIDGTVIDPADYRLDGWRWLTYMDDADGNHRRWPACQALARDDDQPGTFSVSYTHGIAPPQIGLDAAVQLACHLAKSDPACGLPPGTTQVDRQGIRIMLALKPSELPPGFAGLPLVKAFLATVNPRGLTRRSAFFSPDVQQYAQRLGP